MRVVVVRWLLLGLGVATAAPPLDAQQVSGRLTDASGRPASGAIVVAMRGAQDSVVARTVTGPAGTYLLNVAPGRYRLTALRIGLRPVALGEVTLADGDRQRVDGALQDTPIQLEAVTTRASTRCALPARAGAAVVTLFEEARKALTLTQLVPADGRPIARIVLTDQLTDPQGRPLGAPSREVRAGTSTRPFRSLPPALIAQVGYVSTDESGSTYRAPDAAVLLSPEFAAAHCMRVVDGTGPESALVGLAFRPIETPAGIVRVEGTLWLDRASLQLERLEFRYVGLPAAIRRAGFGGTVSFTRLPDGLWFEDRWEIRMPRTSILLQPSVGPSGAPAMLRTEVLDAIQRTRGEVLSLETRGELTYVGNTALEDSIRAESGRAVAVAEDLSDFTEPPACAAIRADSEPAATVYGTVFETPPARSPGAAVTVRWRERFGVTGRFDVNWVDRELSATTAEDGFYSFCGLPRARILRLSARQGVREASPVGARVPWDSDRLRVNLQFTRTPPMIAPRRTVPLQVRTTGGAPVPFAVIDLGPGITRVADSTGVAYLPQSLAAGRRLRVRRIGFAEVDTVLTDPDAPDLHITLRPLGQLLDAVTVVGAPDSPLARAGFYDRVQRVQRGAITAEFITPEEVETRRASTISELLRGRRTITVTRGLTPPRVIVKGRGGCDMTVLLDGQRMRPDVSGGSGASEGAVAIDELVGGRSVLAVEIYPSTANAPAELIGLTGGGSCGIIAIWTGATAPRPPG